MCRLSLSTIYLQVVQRSLSGGFLTQDAALLNANACSMSQHVHVHVHVHAHVHVSEAIQWTTCLGERAAPIFSLPPPLYFSLLLFCKAQVLVVAAAGNFAEDLCSSYYNEITTFDKILVGATDRNDAAWWSSNYGQCVHMQVFNAPPVSPSPICACSPASPAATARRPLPPARVRRPQVPASSQRGSAQATPPQTPSLAPAWRRRMSPASPPSCSRRTRPSR